MALLRFRETLDDYVKNKTWYWYLPFWLLGLYLFIRLFSFELGEPAPSFFISIAQSFNFMLHELAHLVTALLPSLITASAGSGSELLLGLGLIVTAFWTRSYFASLFCFLWFMLAAFATADYIADARSQTLPLISFGGSDPTHDWNFILDKLGLLQHDTLISGLVRSAGTLAGVFGLTFSAWLLVRIIRAGAEAKQKARRDALMQKLANRPPAERGQQAFVSNDLYPTPTKGIASEHAAPTPPATQPDAKLDDKRKLDTL